MSERGQESHPKVQDGSADPQFGPGGDGKPSRKPERWGWAHP